MSGHRRQMLPGLPGGAGLQDAILYVSNGQSNGLGFSSDPRNSTVITLGKGWEYYPAASNSTSPGVFLPLGNCLLGRTGGGLQRAFVEAWTALASGTVLCVNASVSGCTMDAAAKSTLTNAGTVQIGGGTFDLSDGANVYDSWVYPLVKHALVAAARNGFVVRAIVWSWLQGESDAAANNLTSGANYATKCTTYIDRVKADFDVDVFCISELGTNGVTLASSNSYWNDIRNAQSTVVAARPSVAVMGSTAAKGLFDLGQMVDTQHYTQAGYNSIGEDLAQAAHAFMGAPKYRAPDAAFARRLAASFPAIGNWHRVRLTHVCSGNFFPSFFVDPTQPYATTFVDGTGRNPSTGDQTLNWTFTGSDSKQVCVYVHNTVGSSASLVGASADKVTRLAVLDRATKLPSINYGTSGAIGKGFRITDLDFQRLTNVTSVSINVAFADDPRMSDISNATLTALGTGVTTLSLPGARWPLLDYTLVPNVTNVSFNKHGLTTSDVNTILQALDTNGKSSGSVNTVQFNASPAMASAPPSGAGATAKTALQGKSWTVTSD